ncbi:MAG: HAMP domain-containing sensor histidine kinase [Polyangiaceae bacterium]
MKPAFRARLLWRVYFFGFLMLLLAGGASFVVGTYVLKPAVEGPARPATAWIAWHLLNQQARGESIEDELVDLKKSRVEMTLFDVDGTLIASNAEVRPKPLGQRELSCLADQETVFADGIGLVASRDSGGEVKRYAYIAYPQAELPLGTGVAQLLAALGVLGLLSIPLARSITARVEELTRATRAFGAGDLSVRVKSRQPDEIGDLTRAFDEMAERIVRLRRSEKELLANVSHEMRTPLARIRMALDLVRDGDINRASTYLADIEDDLYELEQLLDDVMTTARLDLERGEVGNSQAPLHVEQLEAISVLEAACERFERRYPERALVRDFADPLPLIQADPTLLRRVFDNLLDNAAKFSSADEPVKLSAGGDAAQLVVEVQDHGFGIAEGDRARVFEPFFRADRSRDRATGGVGLGLALVKRILDAHSGNVEIRDASPQGTCFRLTLPAAPAT